MMSSQCLNSLWSPDPVKLLCVLPNMTSKILFSFSHNCDECHCTKTFLLVFAADSCSLRDLSSSLVEENRVCGSVSGGGVCYSGDSVGSVAVYFCDDGYTLEGDTTRECLSSGLWNGTTPQCVERPGENAHSTNIYSQLTSTLGADSHGTKAVASAVFPIIVCSVLILGLVIGVVLGVLGLYLIQRVRGRLSSPTSLSSPPLPPPDTFEEVDVAREVKSSQDIQLMSNAAYGPAQQKDNIPISQNIAYQQVQL